MVWMRELYRCAYDEAADKRHSLGCGDKTYSRYHVYGRDAGMATVEFALTLPAVVFVIVLVISIAVGSSLKIHTCDVARHTARLAATAHITTAEGDDIEDATHSVDDISSAVSSQDIYDIRSASSAFEAGQSRSGSSPLRPGDNHLGRSLLKGKQSHSGSLPSRSGQSLTQTTTNTSVTRDSSSWNLTTTTIQSGPWIHVRATAHIPGISFLFPRAIECEATALSED